MLQRAWAAVLCIVTYLGCSTVQFEAASPADAGLDAATAAGMPIGFVEGDGCLGNDGSQRVDCRLPWAVKQGNSLVVAFKWDCIMCATNPGVTDSEGNHYDLLPTPLREPDEVSPGVDTWVGAAVAHLQKGGVATVMIDVGIVPQRPIQVYIHEYSGLATATANVIDAPARLWGTAAGDTGTYFLNTVADHTLIFGLVLVSDMRVVEAGSGFTFRRSKFNNGTMDREVFKADTYTATATFNKGGPWAMFLLGLRGR